jgi:Skp family chaperone for outer membrane proteins
MQSGYMDEANKAETAYRQVRADLIAKYSAIAHMQFEDNESIAAQADKLAADRRDLYQKIADQVRGQVEQIAHDDGIAVVFGSVRAAGTAVDLTDQVTKAVSSLQASTSLPNPTASGGS